MSAIRKLFASIPFVLVATIVLLGGTVGAVLPVSEFVSSKSLSVESNIGLIIAVMTLIVFATVFETVLVVRLIWGREAITGQEVKKSDGEDEASVRGLKVTVTKVAFILLVLLVGNVFLFDHIGDGVLVTRTRAHYALTLLRSDDAEDRRQGAEYTVVQMIDDQEVTEALGRVIEQPGQAREWVAWAAGVRDDTALKDKIAELLRSGSSRERAAAALSLARMRDGRLLRLAIDAFPHAGDDIRDLLIAVGMLGKDEEVTGEADLAEAGKHIAGLLERGELSNEATLVAIWAIGQLEAPEGLPYLEKLTAPEVGIEAQCTGLEALGKIGAAESSDWLVAMIDKVDKGARCPEVVSRDFTGHEVLLCGGVNLVERILQEIARIGDRQARRAMEKLANDESHSKTVRQMAKDIAFQMRYVPVNTQ
jgi:hypothetical protein